MTPVNIVVLLFFVSFAISTFVGADWYRSFWDNHERMLGLFTIFHYVIYYLIITSVVTEWKEWKWFFRIFLFAGSIVMFIGLLQKFNPELLLNRGSDRVSATLGNSIYFSGYGLFLMFVGYLLAIKEKAKKYNPWFWYAVVGSLLGLWGVFGGGARGALLGLVAGLGVLIISYIFNLKEHKTAKQGLSVLIILGVVVIGLLFNFRQTSFVQSIPAVGRLVNTDVSATNTRVMAWEVAIDAWKEKPVFGWGPNNYYFAYNKYYLPEFLEHGWGETWFDNAHSVVMNTLAVQGGFGILFYLGIYVVALIMLWRGHKKGGLDTHVVAVSFAFLIAHFVSLVTVFDNPTSYLYFFFFFAFVNQQSSPNEQNSTEKKIKEKDISYGLMAVVGFVIFLLIYTTNINPARANKATLVAIQSLNRGENGLELYKVASSIPSPHINDIRNDFANSIASAIPNYIQHGEKDKANEMFNVVLEELKKNRILHPLDIRVNIQIAQLIQVMLQANPSSLQPSMVSLAEESLEKALKYSPKRQQIFYSLSAIKMQLGKFDEAKDLLQKSIVDDPKIGEGWWRLALVHQQAKEYDQAKAVIDEALSREDISIDTRGHDIMNSILTQISTDTKK